MVWKGKILSKQNIFLASKNRKYQCPYPCTLINVKQNVKTFCSVCTPNQPCNRCNSTNRADERYGYIRLMFQENIKFFKSSYVIDLRSFFTLISDIGGCIGIFLGWSILQINEYIYERCISHLEFGKISNHQDTVMEISTEISDGLGTKSRQPACPSVANLPTQSSKSF